MATTTTAKSVSEFKIFNECGFSVDSVPEVKSGFEYKGYHKFGRILGRGSFGTVVECFRKSDSKLVAIKFFTKKYVHKWISKNALLENRSSLKSETLEDKLADLSIAATGDEQIPLETACLFKASNIDGVVKIVDFIPGSNELLLNLNENTNQVQIRRRSVDRADFDSDDSVYAIVFERSPTEVCLFEYLIERHSLDETEARSLIKQIVEINLSLLRAGIVHGDLKSENMLIDIYTKKIKLIDFGSAQFMDSNGSYNSKAVKTFRGTNLYKPPEYLLHHCFYPRPSTVWTFGVILYDMVCGNFPFESEEEILAHKDKELQFLRNDLTASVRDLIRRCLAFYTADRIAIDNILNHEWFKC